MTSSQRLPVLDGLRAISILLVLAAHMLPLGPKFLRLNDAAGAMGMSLFFALSGFLIVTTIIHNSDAAEFIIRRFTRILPLAYAYAIIAFGVVYFDPAAMAWTVSFLINYFPQGMAGGLNNHFWSLCVEIHFYIAIIVVVLLLGKRGVWLVWPACLIVTFLRVADGSYASIQTHLRVDEILAGACVATVYQSRWTQGFRSSAFYLALPAGLWFIASHPETGWFHHLRPYATAALLMAVLQLGTSSIALCLSSPPLRYLAAISYALYVIHPISLHGWLNQGSTMERYLLKRPLSFAITFVLAHLSTFYWERFWQQAGRIWVQRLRERRKLDFG